MARVPRITGDYISTAMAAVAGLTSAFGVMISASRNPAHDNGIKFLAFGGQKLSQGLRRRSKPNCCGPARVRSEPVWAGSGNLQTPRIDIWPISCPLCRTAWTGAGCGARLAHGAASHCFPRAFQAAGASVVVIGAEPAGTSPTCGHRRWNPDGPVWLQRLHARGARWQNWPPQPSCRRPGAPPWNWGRAPSSRRCPTGSSQGQSLGDVERLARL
jgi:hypothetical protein